jgi:hypothetical protein
MIGTWWLLWMGFLLLILLPPVSYGWGYRGWGAPYPSFVQRRRGARAAAAGASSKFDHRSWGLRGDVMWFVLIVWLAWPIVGYWHH